MQQASYSIKDPINMLSSQDISQHISIAFIDPKTHTHTKQVGRAYVNHVRNICHLELANPLTKCHYL